MTELLIRPNFLCKDCGNRRPITKEYNRKTIYKEDNEIHIIEDNNAKPDAEEMFHCSILGRFQESPSHCFYYCGTRTPIDIVIITAVRVEYNSVLNYLHPSGKAAWQQHSTVSNGEWQICTYTSPVDPGIKVRIALMQLTMMGLAAAAAATAQAMQIFRPNYVVMLGITAGRDGKTQIGDIIAPSAIWDYGAGKWTEQEGKLQFLARARPRAQEDLIVDRCKSISENKTDLIAIHTHWQSLNTEGETFTVPKVRTGPLVSGAAVIDSEQIWKQILTKDDTIIAIDMEAYGVIQATKSTRNALYNPQWLIAKSVCDYGSKKHDGAQAYSAYTSVRFFRLYLDSFILQLDPQKLPKSVNIHKFE